MRENIQKYIQDGMKNRNDRIIVFSMLTVIAICLAFSIFWLLRTPAAAEETTLCEHELAHLNGEHAGCAYSAGALCGHVHGDECISVPASPGTPCAHVCSEAAGCTPIYIEVEGEQVQNGFTCNHTSHDGSCGYSEATAAVYGSCEHEHDDCGYSPAVACDFVCTESACLIAPANEPGIDQGLVATLTCQDSYFSGSPMQFVLRSSYSHAGSDGTVSDEKAKVRIEINENKVSGESYRIFTNGTETEGDYAGWEYISVAADSEGGEARRMYYKDGAIEYELKSGDSFVGYIDISYPNGYTENGTEITLTPSRVGEQQPNDKFEAAETTIVAGFDWSDVIKTQSRQNLGNPSSGFTANNIDYYITTNKEFLPGASTTNGNIFTSEYTLTDTITFDDVYFDFSDTYGKELELSTGAAQIQYRVEVSPGVYKNVLTSSMSLGESNNVTLEPIYDLPENPTHIIGFVFTYKKVNTTPATADLPNINNLRISLCIHPNYAGNFLFLNPKPTGGSASESPYGIKNEVEFEAKSVLYGTEGALDENHYHESDFEVESRGVVPKDSIWKSTETIYDTDGVERNPVDLIHSGSRGTSSSSMTAGESFYYRIRFANEARFYDTLYISDSLQYFIDNKQALVPGSFEIVGIATYFDGGMIEYIGDEFDGTVSGGQVGWDGSKTTATTVESYKQFTNVPVGAEIIILCKVTVNEEITRTHNPCNTAIASTGYDKEGFAPVDVIDDGSTYKWITPVTGKIQVQKIFLETDGHSDTYEGVTNYYYNVGDPVQYEVTISNSSIADSTINFVDTWPGSGVELTEISGVPAGCSVELYDAVNAKTPYKTIVSDGSPIVLSLSERPMKIRIPGLVIPAKQGAVNGSVTIVTKGKVIEDGEYTNTADVEGGTGIGSSLTFSTKHLGTTTVKTPYLVTPDASGGMNWDSSAQTHTGYFEGSVVRFEISVKNNSLTNEVINNVLVFDTFDSLYQDAGTEPSVGTYGGVNGKVIAEYPGGRFEVLGDISWESLVNVQDGGTAKGFHRPSMAESSASGLQSNIILFAVNDANLKPGEAIKFHVFFEITESVMDTFSAQSAPWLGNHVRTYTWDHKDPPGDYLESSYWTYIIPLEDGYTRSVDVTKSPIAIYGGLNPQDNGTSGYKNPSVSPNVAAGNYIVYNVRIDNTSNYGDEGVAVYQLIDTLPEGTTYVGITRPSSVGQYMISDLNKTKSGDAAIAADYYKEGSGPVNLPVNANINYNDETRRLEITFPGNPALNSGDSAEFAIVVQVTENHAFYDNVAGYVVDSDVSTNGSSVDAGDDKKYIYDNAEISGPVYYAGIEKTAQKYNFGGNLSTPDWKDMGSGGNYVAIQPKYQILWNLKLENGAQSTTEIKNYQVVDILPAEFNYVAGSSKLGKATIGNPTIDTLPDGRKQLTWTIPNTLAVGASIDLSFVSEWDASYTEREGLYQNQASIVLTNYNVQGSTHGELDKAERTITDYAQVNMLGSYGTTSFKRETNTTPSSPFYNQTAAGIDTTGHINAIAGDTIRYSLNITNRTGTDNVLANLVIIDSLPRIGDTGVINRQINRNSKFNVTFPAAPNVSVEIIRASGPSENVDTSKFTVEYMNLGTGGTLSESDWAGTTAWNASPAEADSIRIKLDDSLLIAKDDTVIVSFDAIVAGETGADAALPSSEEFAWNSFGYAYKMKGATVSPTLYAEPIKVGVKIPYATINVSKTVVEAKSGNIVNDTTPFTFVLSRKTADGTGWEPARGVRYMVNGTVTVIGDDGRFTVKGGDSVALCVPASNFYKVEEVDVPVGYTLKSVAGNGTNPFETGQLLEGASITVPFVNESAQDKWSVQLLKKSSNDETQEGVTFTLQRKGENDEFAVYGGYDEVSTDENGVYMFNNLPAGVYKLIEVQPLDKYNPVDDIIFTLPYEPSPEGDALPEGVTIVPTAEGDADFLITVINYRAYELPEAGGEGVLPLLFAGALLMAGAITLGANTFFSKKRRVSKATGESR